MNKNIIPYLKYTEFEDVYKPNHFHTGHDFFIFPKNYSFYDSTKKNISYFPNHISEYNKIIPEYDINNISYIENKRSFNNNILSETRELSPINNNNFLYTSKSIYLDDIHYQKYMLNLKNDNNSNSNSKAKKVINKKNNSLNKNQNAETYSIIQIYEAPPLELTPIEENEKEASNDKRRKPKYYRKKTIYTLENNFASKNKIDDKFINLNYSILDSSQDNILLKSIKSNTSKTKKRIFDNKEESNNKDEEKETHKIEKSYFKYITKDKKENTEPSFIESNSNNNYKKYIKKEKENKIKLKENNFYNKYLSNKSKEDKKEVVEKDKDKDKDKDKGKDKYKNKDKDKDKEKEKEKEKDKVKEKEIVSKSNYRNKIKNESMDTKEREKEIFKKIENKKYSYRSSRKYSDNKNSKQSLTIDKGEKGDKSQSNIFEEEKKDKLIKKEDNLNKSKNNGKNGKEQKKIMKNNIEIIKSKRLSEDNKENFSKNITIISDDKIQKDDDNTHNISNPNIERPKKYFNFEKKDEKTIVKNLLFEKSNIYSKKEEEKKIEKNYKFEKIDEQKLKERSRDIKTPQQNSNRYSFKQIRIKDNNTKDIAGTEIIKTNEKEKTENKCKNEKKGKTNVILNIEVDKSQLSGNKRTYLYSKVERELAPEQNSAKISKISDNMNKNIKNNYSKKYVYSFSVEKNPDNIQSERPKIYTERKKIDDTTNKQKQNETNKTNIEKDSKKIGFNLQSKNMNNSAITSKIELDKSDNRNSNEKEMKKNNLILELDKSSDKKSNGLATPNHRSYIKNEESKNNDISSFGNTTRKFVCNYINDNNNKDNKKNNNESINNLKNNNIKKDNVNNSKVKNQSKDLKKENINNPKNNNNNQNKETKNENNLKTIINSTHKNVYRNNHNYIAIKSSGPRKINNISQYRPMKTEKTEKVNDSKKVGTDINSSNYLSTEAIPSVNKIEPKQNSNNNRANTRRLTNDINNINVNNTSNSNTATNNNSNYQVLRATSVKSVDIKAQNPNDAITKRKTIIGQINNHSMKMSYGLTTFKFPAEKKESENKIANSNSNKNTNEVNLITNYINSKVALNNSGLSNNNNNTENKNNVNSFINIDRSRRDAKAKNNHSLYVSISSKK